MFVRRLYPWLALFLATCSGCSGCHTNPTPPTTAAPPPVTTSNGLDGQERTRFHHLAEGSEVYPLSWVKALTNPNTGKPFLDNIERFGFLPDPDGGSENPYGLPVGMSVAESDLPAFGKVQMIGVNCAACHVNDLYRNGERVMRIDGAPNLFDLGSFYAELATDTEATLVDPAKAWAFALALYKDYNTAEQSVLVAPRVPDSAAIHDLRSLSDLKKGGDFEQALAKKIEDVHKQEVAKPAVHLKKSLAVTPADNAKLNDYLKANKVTGGAQPKAVPKDMAALILDARTKVVGAVDVGNVKALAAMEPMPGSAIAKLTPTEREANLTGAIEHFVETVRLLRSRLVFLTNLAKHAGANDTRAGFGRVDAFGGARNFIFAVDLPLNAPISYPHLWNLKQIRWYHWDANSTSLLERNVGQALGLGALFDPDTFDSTVLVKNIEELEVLAGKIQPPVWPEKAFGKIDQAKSDKGKVLFDQHCSKCHPPLKSGEMMADLRQPLSEGHTDPLRAENFARDINGQHFDDALSDALKKITKKAGGTVSDKKEWRLTHEYAMRPLVAPWATAPYLHNNSVPTLADLLLPPDQRPKTFAVGSREYDPVKLGFSTTASDTSVTYDTTLPGNSNLGHDYGTGALSPDDRSALLEYLKTLK